MKYSQTIRLKNGADCCLRNGTEADGRAALALFILTHGETDYLLSYPDENSIDVAQESRFLQEKTESENEIEILAFVGDTLAGTAGIEALGGCAKLRHRADFGVCVAKAFWGLGIGRALTEACIRCAREAGYLQLELNVVAENEKAISLYQSLGFVEYGRNPRGFRTRTLGYQELVYMRMEL